MVLVQDCASLILGATLLHLDRSAELWCKSRAMSHELSKEIHPSEVYILMENMENMKPSIAAKIGFLLERWDEVQPFTPNQLKSASDPGTGGPLPTWQVTSTGPCSLKNLT